ncbi:MAG TPA: glucokinase [Crenotrichaceae bacterium]|nr:glucokinase [Crenotrichaceae bacterium]
MILAGDVGGTNTRLALVRRVRSRFYCEAHTTFPSADYASLEQIINAFKAANTVEVDSACIGVAGVVLNRRCDATNLPWVLDEQELASTCQLTTVRLINDLEAAAYGILVLGDTDFVDLNPHAQHNPDANKAVIAAGTGLGEAVMFWDGSHYHPFATEGGHCDFAPADQQQDALLEWLRHRWNSHVSYERIISGPGLLDIYRWLIESGRQQEKPHIQAAMQRHDPGSVISETAIAKRDPGCEQALHLFVQIYAQEAGNLALKSLATGGIYLAGGIAPKILPALQTDAFLQHWLAKGRFADLLRNIPVKLVLHPHVSLFGAANYLQNQRLIE